MKTSQSAAASNSAALGRSALGSSSGQRLPVPPRERKPALAALAVLLILGGALTSAYLVMASGERISAIRIVQPVAAGQKIPLSAMEEVQIGDTGIDYLAWSERGKVSRSYASVPLVRGSLLTNAMMTQSDEAAKGRVIIGLALKVGQLPAGGVDAGDRVGLYAVGTGNTGGPRPGTVLSDDAIVYEVAKASSDRFRSGDQTTISVAVSPDEAPLLTQAASAGAVAVARIPAGTKVTIPPKQNTAPPSGQQSTPAGG